MNHLKLCFTGGGTAGHIFPALAVDKQLLKLSGQNNLIYSRFWIGSKKEQEKLWVEQNQIPFYAIETGKLRRYFSLRNIGDIFLIIIGFFQALKILKKERPTLIFSKGGYVSVGVVYAAKILNIKIITHESDTMPGLATKLNSFVAFKVCLPFEEAKIYYSKSVQNKLVVTGVPTLLKKESASKEKAYKLFNLDQDRALVVVLGGSQGSLQINTLLKENLDKLLPICNIVHQVGSSLKENIYRKNYIALSFINEELQDLLAAATLVVSRSGATAIADFMEMEVPMLLIPLSLKASRGDQIENSRRLVEKGAALVLEDEKEFVSTVRNVLNCAIVREDLKKHSSSLYIKGADKKLATLIIESVERRL